MDRSEDRVARYIVEKSGIGAGIDPIGFILSSYEYNITQLQHAKKIIKLIKSLTKSDLTTSSGLISKIIEEYENE